MRYDNILETVGRTPVVRLQRVGPPHVRLYAKVEAFNPLGSVKDRLALGIIEDAERKGVLRPGQTVVEATSGNTGIALAMVCAQKGYPLVVVMAENFSVERRKLMRFLGARVVLTPAAQKGTGMVAKAEELARAHGWFLCRQFENEANAEVHSRTTAREILDDFADDRLDYWVTGAGTGGTLKGTGRVLRAQRPETKIVLCEPDNSPMIGSRLPQPRRPDGSIAGSHPLFRPHLVQGWAPDFIPRLTEEALALALVDQVVAVSSGEAIRLSRLLAEQEGIFTGISGGATLAGALEVCRAAPEGSVVLCMLPDTGERYLSTPLFDGVSAEMSDQELEISRSTPSCRFDGAPAVVPAGDSAPPQAAPAAASPEAEAFLRGVLDDPAQPVVLFAFCWCEFCWSVRKLFARCQIPFRVVELDAAPMLENNAGQEIRAALAARTGSPTIPQVFVGGQLVGGARAVFDAFSAGELQRLLALHRVSFDETAKLDPYSLMPAWVQGGGAASCRLPG